MSKFVLGLDAGFGRMGYAVAKALSSNEMELLKVGILETKPKHRTKSKPGPMITEDDVRRIKELVQGLIDLCPISAIFAELPHGGTKPGHQRTAHTMGMSKGIIVAFAELMKVPFCGLTPYEVKAGVTGKKMASKDAVREKIIQRYPSFPSLLLESSGLKLSDVRAEDAIDATATLMAGMDTDIWRGVIL